MTAIQPKAEQTAETFAPTALHLSFAKYGRVGKTTWCKLLIEYMLDKRKRHIIVDTDKETPNVARAYTPKILDVWAGNEIGNNDSIDNLLLYDDTPNVENDDLLDNAPHTDLMTDTAKRINTLLTEQIVFSEDNRTAYLTRNLLSLSRLGQDVLVNLPANVYQPVCDFIATNNLHRSSKIKLFNWWVSNGSEESLELFLETQAKFPQAKHVLVLNQGNFQYVYDWKRFRLPKPIVDLYQNNSIKIVKMPFLSVEPGLWHSLESIPYHDIIKDEAIDEFVRDAIEMWMIRAFDQIEATAWL